MESSVRTLLTMAVEDLLEQQGHDAAGDGEAAAAAEEEEEEDDASSVASSMGFETADLPSDEECSASLTHGSSAGALQLDWEASAPLQASSPPEKSSCCHDVADVSQLETQRPSQLGTEEAPEGRRNCRVPGVPHRTADAPSRSGASLSPTPASNRADDSLGDSQSQSPSQALFSFGGGHLTGPQDVDRNDGSQSQQSASLSVNASQSQSPSQSLWGTRQRPASPDKNEVDCEESLSLSQLVNANPEVPAEQEPGTAEAEPVDTRSRDMAPKNTNDSVPAGFRRIRGMAGAQHLCTTAQSTRQQSDHVDVTGPAASTWGRSAKRRKIDKLEQQRAGAEQGNEQGQNSQRQAEEKENDTVQPARAPLGPNYVRQASSSVPGCFYAARINPPTDEEPHWIHHAHSSASQANIGTVSSKGTVATATTGGTDDEATEQMNSPADTSRPLCLSQRIISDKTDSHGKDACLINEATDGVVSSGVSKVPDGLDPEDAARSIRDRARAESRVQRLCKIKYTRTSFRNRPAATNHGSRLDRVIEKGSKFADCDDARQSDQTKQLVHREPSQNINADDQSSTNADVDHGDMHLDKTDCRVQLGASIHSADESQVETRQVVEKTQRDAWDWQAWESSDESSDDDDEKEEQEHEEEEDEELEDADYEFQRDADPAQKLGKPSRSSRVASKFTKRVLSPPRRVQTRRSSQRRLQHDRTRSSSTAQSAPEIDPWRRSLRVGSRLDAMDSWGKWYEGVVVDTKQGHGNDAQLPASLRIHFMTWSPRYQEWFDVQSQSLQPLNTHPHAPSGDAPDYVPLEARTGFRASGQVRRLTKKGATEGTSTKSRRCHEPDDSVTERGNGSEIGGIFHFSDAGNGNSSEELATGADRSSPKPFSRPAGGSKRKGSPIVPRRKKSPKANVKQKRDGSSNASTSESWVVGGRWDIARSGFARGSPDVLNQAQDKGQPAVANTKPTTVRTRKRPSKNQPAIDAANSLAGANSPSCSACDECGKSHTNSVQKSTADSNAKAPHNYSPGRNLCNACAKRRAYIRSRTKMGTVVARVTRRVDSTEKSSPARQRPRGTTRKIFDGIDFCFVDRNSARSAAADAARDLLASQIRSCGGKMVSLTPKYVRGIDHRTMRLVCLASSPNKMPEYMLALAIGATPLSTEWPARCMQDETLHPTSDFQLPQLRVAGTGSGTSASPAGARGEIGRILPIERRVLRTAKGRDPLLLGVRASTSFTKQWEPLLRAAGAHCVPVVTSSVAKKPPRVHAYVCDGTDPPSTGSRVPCVSLAWLSASLVSQRRRPFNDKAFAVPSLDAEDSQEPDCSQRF